MKRWIVVLCLLLFAAALLGCPGARALDKEANEKLWELIQEQDANGWTVTGFPDTTYQGVVLDHRFKPTRFEFTIDGSVVNPLHQANMLEDIARQWRNCYPGNMRPRFNLRVVMYDKEMERDFELGYTEIDENGSVDTHHHLTGAVM